MSKKQKYNKENFAKLMLASFNSVSSDEETAKEYLIAEGIDANASIEEGLAFIRDLQSWNQNIKIKSALPVENSRKKWTHKSVIKLIEESGNKNPVEEIRQRARDLVVQALDAGWSGPPFNAIELSKYLGMQIVANDHVLDARTIPVGNSSFLIEYNPHQKPTRINFSIAHEIAHTLFSDCRDTIRNREEKPTFERELEQLCNVGASEIQLPYAIFSHDANGLENLDLEGLIALATKYKASLESLFLRFIEVTDKSCSILICSFREENSLVVEYAKSSKNFPSIIPFDYTIPTTSVAYECLSPGWSSRETIGWDILDGAYNIFCIGLSPMRKDNRARVGIFIAAKGEENLQDKKIVMEFGDATKPRGGGKKIIAQVVNTSGALGFGFGKSLTKNFPIVKTELKSWHADKESFVLGNTNFFDVDSDLYVCQILAQKGLHEKNGEIPLKYSALKNGLSQLYEKCIEYNATVHMPRIGAGQARGNWEIIQGIIHDELTSKGVKVCIYILPGDEIRKKSNLTLFNEKSTWHKER